MERDKEKLAIREKIALAKVGIIALIDEATGYQEERFEQDGNPLHEMLKEFMDDGDED